MVLCAATADADAPGGERVELVVPPAGAAIGEVVAFEGLVAAPPAAAAAAEGAAGAPAPAAFVAASPSQVEKKKIWQAVSPDLATDAERAATWQGRRFMTSAGPCTAKTIAGGTVR